MAGYQGSSTRRIDAEALDALIDARLRDSRFAMKAVAGAYDPATQTGSVTPKLTMTVGSKTVTAPALDKIPVVMPRGGGYGIHLPIKSGDALTLLALDRPQTAFLESGGDASLAQGRVHDINNVIALPGGYPDGSPMTGVGDDAGFFGSIDGKRGFKSSDDGSVAMKGGPSGGDKFKITAGGKIDLVGENGDSVIQIIRDALVLIRDHLNGGAPTDAGTQAAANALIAKIDGIKA